MNIFLDTSPTKNGHSHRGIGLYTAQLKNYLEKTSDVNLLTDDTKKKSADLIHYPFFDLFFHTLPILKPVKHSVVTIHDVIPLQFPTQYKPGLKGSVSLKAQMLALKNVDAILTDSHSSKMAIVKHLGVTESKVHVVYLAGNPELEKVSAAKIASVAIKHQLPANYVLYVGDINYNKNIPQLIKAMKFLSADLQLVLVGKNFRKQDIPEWQWIETQIALSDVTSRVKFIPALGEDANSELSALYSAATVYVQPSLAEGFGLPVLEAMQCKTPVVCTNLTSLPEIAGSHAQYCEAEANSIAQAIESVCSFSQSKRKTVVEDAYEWSQSFTWQKTATQTAEVYKTILK